MVFLTHPSQSHLCREGSSQDISQRRPTNCLSPGAQAAGTVPKVYGLRSASQTLPNSVPRKEASHHSWASSWPSLVLLGRPGPGSWIGQGLHSFYSQKSPWRPHPANQKSKVFIHSVAGRAGRAPPPRPPPPPGVEGEKSQSPRSGLAGHTEEEGRQHSAAPRLPGRGRLAGSGVWRTRRWAGQRSVAGRIVAAPAAGPGSGRARGPGVLLPCLGSQDPQRPGGWSPPQPAARLAVPEPSWNWLDRQLRH